MFERPVLLRWLTENEADTRDPDGPPPLRLWAPFTRVWTELMAEVRSRSRWTLVSSDRIEGRVEVEVRSRVFGFVDDLEVEVGLDASDGLTVVHARSASRSGRGDLGVNRRRIRRLFRWLRREVED